jgi:hypothetical protein
MTDIVERLRTFYTSEDHERGCKGREYDCSCGYDDNGYALITEAADEIERLRKAIDQMTDAESTLEVFCIGTAILLEGK